MSAVRIGAVDVGSAAGAPEGATHAMVVRNVVTDHPAAGAVAPWQATQWASRMGATSVSKTGGVGDTQRSWEQAEKNDEPTSAPRTSDVRVPDRAAIFRGITLGPP